LSVLSSLPDKANCPLGLKAIEFTQSACPVKVWIGVVTISSACTEKILLNKLMSNGITRYVEACFFIDIRPALLSKIEEKDFKHR